MSNVLVIYSNSNNLKHMTHEQDLERENWQPTQSTQSIQSKNNGNHETQTRKQTTVSVSLSLTLYIHRQNKFSLNNKWKKKESVV